MELDEATSKVCVKINVALEFDLMLSFRGNISVRVRAIVSVIYVYGYG